MEYRFNAEEWKDMSPRQRMKRCLILAGEAHKLAHKANKRFKPLYLALASDWLTLASEIGDMNAR